MPDQKITDLGDGGLPQPTDDFVVARAGTNNKLAWSSLAAAATEGNVAIAGSNTTYTSGTVVLTGAGGGVTVGSAAGQQVVVSVAAPVAQSVQTQNVVDLTLDGNTAGALQLVSSGTLTLAGGNNITLSQNGNAITISGPNAGGAQTGISSIGNSETTYSSGAVDLVATGAITIASGAPQQFVFSVNPQSVQPETQTFIAGVSASDTLYTSGNVRITGVGGGVTVGSNTGQRIDISVAAQSVQPETQTFVAGISASNTLYTSGNVRFTGSQAVTVRSGTGQLVVIDVPAQTTQVETQTFLGGVAGSNATYTSGTALFTGVGGGITVSSNTGQRIDLSVAAQSNQAGSVYASSNTFGTSSGTYDARSLSIAGRGEISVAASNSGWIISAPAQTEQTQSRFNLTLSGNSTSAGAGYIQISSGVMTLAGGNNVTLSQNGNAVTISGANAGGAQTAISGLANSETTYTSGTVSLSELGALTIRSTTGNQFQFSVPATSSLSATGEVSISVDGSTISIGAPPALIGVSTGGNTAGDTGVTKTQMVFVGSNNITLSQATGAAGGTISILGAAGAGATAISGIANSETTYTSGTVSLSELGAITIRSTTGNQFQFSVNAQTNQAGSVYASSNTFGTSSGTYDARSISIAGSGNVSVAASNSGWVISVPASAAQTNQSGNVYASSNTFGTSSGTYDARSISIAGRGAVSVAASNSGWIISAPAQTAQSGISAIYDGANSISTGTVSMANANGVSFSVNANTLSASVNQSISMYAVSNTTQSTSGTAHKSALSFGGAGIASVGVTGGSVVISVPAGGGAGYSAGVSTGGNTAGATGITGSNLVFVGTNMISLSQTTGANGGTVSINATQSVQTAGIPALGVSTGGATSGDTGVNSGTRFVLVGTNLTMSQGTAANATTVTVSAPATSSLSATGGIEISTNGSTISIGYRHTLADYENFPRQQASLVSHVSGFSKTPIYWNEHIDGDLTAMSLAWGLSMVTASQPLSVSVHMGFYTLVNSTSANLLGSFSEAYVISSATSVSLSGIRNVIATKIGTHAALSTISGGEYIIGMMFSATATNAMNFSLLGASGGAGALGGLYPGTNQFSAATNQNVQVMAGRGSTTVNAMPNAISSADIRNQGGGASQALHPWIYIRS